MNRAAKDLFYLEPENRVERDSRRGDSEQVDSSRSEAGPSPYIPPSYNDGSSTASKRGSSTASKRNLAHSASSNAASSNAKVKTTFRTGFRTGTHAQELRQCMNQLAGLIANVTEAYTAAIFLASDEVLPGARNGQQSLSVEGVHTLSREFVHQAKIGFGRGLVGWTAENKVRISVCPFEHDATTLGYYHLDQDLKSFIAVPILNAKDELLGVISCDSKKSYAFAKIAEKILVECAAQAASVIELVDRGHTKESKTRVVSNDSIDLALNTLRQFSSEDALLSAAAKLPADLISRDALVVMTTQEGGVGAGKFYTSSAEERIGHRLLDLVCRHKKILCKERSVHALPVDDIKHRSFLSIPFHVLEKEAGSLNLLSQPSQDFSTTEIIALEKVAVVLGRELEHIRLRETAARQTDLNGHLSWKHFLIRGKVRLAEAEQRGLNLRLYRLEFSNLNEVEEYGGVDVASAALNKILRLVDQIARPPAISCCVYGTAIVILCEQNEGERIMHRLQRLIERIGINDFLPDERNPSIKIGDLLLKGLKIGAANFPEDVNTIPLLCAAARKASARKA